MSSLNRVVVVDDTDPTIRYTGSWVLDQGSQDQFGIYGPEYNHTLHGSSTNGDSFSFAFNGTSVLVYGSMDTVDQKAPTWDCFVDEINIGSLPPQAASEHDNAFILCNSPLTDISHVLTVNVTSSNSTFWFDSIIYQPSASASLDAVTLKIQNTDPACVFGSGWSDWGDGVGNVTTTAGSNMSFTFNGTTATLGGVLPNGATSSATYSVDGGSPVTFTLIGHDDTPGGNDFNQILFTTPELTPGTHSVVVTYTGATNTTPLIVDYFYVTTSPAKTFTSTNATSSSPALPPSKQSSPSTKHNTPLGAIVGGVIGGLVLIVLIAAIIWLRRRKHRSTQDAYTAAPTFDDGSPRLVGGHLPHQIGSDAAVEPFMLENAVPRARLAQALQYEALSSGSSGHQVGSSSQLTLTVPSHSSGTVSAMKNEQTMAALAAAPMRREPIMHVDSGVRMNRELEEEPLELPPVYAAD